MGKQFIGIHMVPTFDTAGSLGDRWEEIPNIPNAQRIYMEVISRTLKGCKGCDAENTRDCALATGTGSMPLEVGERVTPRVYANMVQIYKRKGVEGVDATHAVRCTHREVKHGDSKGVSAVVGTLIRSR